MLAAIGERLDTPQEIDIIALLLLYTCSSISSCILWRPYIDVRADKMATLQPVEYQPADRLQPPYSGHGHFPLALSAVQSSHSQNGTPSISSLTEQVARLSSDNEIRALLDAHGGAIFFPNLGLLSPNEFSAFAGAFGWKAHEDIGNPVRRTIIAPNVATANEGPNTKPVYPHNEFGLSPHYPAYVLFYCEKAPESGKCQTTEFDIISK